MQRTALTLGSLLVSRAYAAWYDIDEAQVAFSEGVDPVFVPPAGPGSVPTTTALIADALGMLKTGQVQALALSGDDRLLPLIAEAHASEIPVGLVGHSCAPDSPCLRLVQFAEPASSYSRSLRRSERYRRPSGAKRSV